MAKDIQRFYQQCDPATALGPGDERYVPFQGVRGAVHLMAQLTNAIRWSNMPHHLLFTGHRGGGKSTELLRLQHDLEHPPEGIDKFFVIYFEVDREDIDVNDVDFPDILLAIIRQVGKALRQRMSIDLRPSWLERLINGFKRLLGSDIEVEKLDLDVKIAKLTAVIKNSLDARTEIRQALEPDVSNLIVAANDILDQARTKLAKQGYRDLVVIVDNLDRVVLRDIPNSQFNSHEQLFINRGSQLTQLRCHVVYTLPISLVFSPRATALVNVFGGSPVVLPMVKVIQGKNRRVNPTGMKAMRDIVIKRLNMVNIAESDAVDSPKTLDYLCRMSGGHVRNLLLLICEACTAAGQLPLTQPVSEHAVRKQSTDFERALNRPEFFDTLAQIEQTADLPGSEHDPLLMYNLSVLEYLNGDASYAVNPAVRELEKFKEARRALSRQLRQSQGVNHDEKDQAAATS